MNNISLIIHRANEASDIHEEDRLSVPEATELLEEEMRKERIKALEWVLIATGRWNKDSDVGLIELSSVELDRIIASEIIELLE